MFDCFFWWKNDLTTSEDNQVDAVTSSYGLSQLICEPTHILLNSPWCIDLIFINQNKLIMDSRVHAPLHPNCHHQIAYVKLNLYERLVWKYKKKLTHSSNIQLGQTT